MKKILALFGFLALILLSSCQTAGTIEEIKTANKHVKIYRYWISSTNYIYIGDVQDTNNINLR